MLLVHTFVAQLCFIVARDLHIVSLHSHFWHHGCIKKALSGRCQQQLILLKLAVVHALPRLNVNSAGAMKIAPHPQNVVGASKRHSSI